MSRATVPSCFCRQRFVVPKNFAPYRLLRSCVLSLVPSRFFQLGFDADETLPGPASRVRRNRRSQVAHLQQLFRFAHFDLIADHPDSAGVLVWSLNCVPAGVRAIPATQECQNAKVCPWCFTRHRLIRIQQDVLAAAANQECRVFSWRRDLPFESVGELPFFSRHFCHERTAALLTEQTLVPFLDDAASPLKFRHFGIQLFSPDADYVAIGNKLQESSQQPMRFNNATVVTEKNIRAHLKSGLTFDWSLLAKNKSAFSTLFFGLKKAKLLRIYGHKAVPKVSKPAIASISLIQPDSFVER